MNTFPSIIVVPSADDDISDSYFFYCPSERAKDIQSLIEVRLKLLSKADAVVYLGHSFDGLDMQLAAALLGSGTLMDALIEYAVSLGCTRVPESSLLITPSYEFTYYEE